MKISIATRGMAHQRAWGELLAAGLARLGHEAAPIEAFQPAETEVVACWGWKVGRHYREAGHDVLVAERGYVGDRMAWTGLGWNGLNGRAAFALVDDGGERLARHHKHLLEPEQIRRPELPALIMGQVPGDQSVAGVDMDGWYARMAGEWAPAAFRAHPMALQRGLGFQAPPVPVVGGSLADAFAGARRVITWNSNSGVDALLAGMPVEVYDEGGMAWPCWAGNVGRARLLGRLAWCQWTAEEIADGSALERVLGARGGAAWHEQQEARDAAVAA